MEPCVLSVLEKSFTAIQPLDKVQTTTVTVPLSTFHRGVDPVELRPKVLDLFAGAGGFSLGFEAAGAKVAAAIEIDAWACETLANNHKGTHVVKADIATLDDSSISELGWDCDIVIGGPPCQGYSIANKNAGDPTDPRNSLFIEFLRTVSIVRPKALILENVPGLLKRRAQSKLPVIDIIVKELEALGYSISYKVLEAQSYGVPQLRPRLFVVGYRRKTTTPFPLPTHGPIQAADHGDLFSRRGLAPYVTLWDAISDLPELEAREGAEVMPYSSVPQNPYQKLMRADSSEIYNNVAMRHSARLVERFSHVGWGESGMDVPEEHRSRMRGDYSTLSGKSYSQNNRRMHPDRPCHTVPASFYANFIHPYRHRNFTPREGARIQSFPDWYRFSGKPTVVSTKLLGREARIDELHLCQYNQIGNAVPPLMAYHLAKHLLGQIAEGAGH
jgi:DNA (cytosine-5)-methyltransferase 1